MVSDEVSQFLKEAAQLRDQQIQEDKRRSSQLEEEIMAARLERQARRAGECEAAVVLCRQGGGGER
jgi:hypothetical protein